MGSLNDGSVGVMPIGDSMVVLSPGPSLCPGGGTMDKGEGIIQEGSRPMLSRAVLGVV